MNEGKGIRENKENTSINFETSNNLPKLNYDENFNLTLTK